MDQAARTRTLAKIQRFRGKTPLRCQATRCCLNLEGLWAGEENNSPGWKGSGSQICQQNGVSRGVFWLMAKPAARQGGEDATAPLILRSFGIEVTPPVRSALSRSRM